MHHLSIITILERFSDNKNIHNFKIHLAMENAVTSCNGKICVFFNEDIEGVINDEDEQQITCESKNNDVQKHFTITFIYANIKDHLIKVL